jgi:hypothetical protein
MHHKFILQGTPYLPVLRKVMVSIAILDMTTVTAHLNPPNVPLHLDDRHTHSKCLLDQVISFFGEGLEVPAAGVERPGIVPGYTTWIWEAPQVEESYAPQSRAGNGLHTPLLTLRAIKPSDADRLYSSMR